MSRQLVTVVCFGIIAWSGAFAQVKVDKPTSEEIQEKKDAVEKALADAPKSPGSGADPNTYLLGPEDIIYVSVWHDPDFSRPHIIRPDGKITLPLVKEKEIQAAGLTPVQLGKKIAEVLSAILNDPQVDVTVTQVNSKKYYIQGEVNKSGAFPLVVPTTVLEALSNCGGFKDFANKKKITILRKGKQIKFNYSEVVKGKKGDQNILLEPGDYIIIP